MKKDIEFEKGVRFLVGYLPESKEDSRKPVLFHSIRVGMYLFRNGHPRDVILGGLLHDALEFGEVSEKMIRKEFGENVLELVKANTKDRSIANPDERIDELAKRCAEAGKDALIIRAADTLDSFKYYTKVDNRDELDYCRKNAEAIFRYKDKDVTDEILDELQSFI